MVRAMFGCARPRIKDASSKGGVFVCAFDVAATRENLLFILAHYRGCGPEAN